MFRKVLGYSSLLGASAYAVATSYKYDFEIDAVALVRISRAVATVADIGYCYKTQLYSKGLDNTSDEYLLLRNEVHKIAAEKLLNLCKKNKGVYIKVGQHIGALDYLLPPEFVDTLKILHRDAPSNTVEQLYKVIREDLQEEPSDIFQSFESEPLGTASLAQVHKATLHDGSTVAVKVQHFFVKSNTKADIRSMELLVNVMSWAFPDFSMQWLVDETKRNIYRELDFIQEGKNAEKVAEMFKEYSWLKIPKIYWKYTTDRVLVMEYVDGGQVNDLKYVQENNIDPYDVSKKLGDLYSHMIFVNGFVHSDPHPGNILLKKNSDDKSVSVYLLDHGLYATLTDDFRSHYSQFWLSIINRDFDEMKIQAEYLGIKDDMYAALACIVTGRPWSVILKGINENKPGETERTQVRNNLPNVIDKIAHCLQNIDRQALLILKTNDLIRGIEFSLKTNEMMVSFAVMTKCLLISIYDDRFKKATTSFERMIVGFGRTWTMFKFYVYFTFQDIRTMFKSIIQ